MVSLDPNRPWGRFSKKILVLTISIAFSVIIGCIIAFGPPITSPEAITAERENITPIDAAKKFDTQNAIDFSTKICDLGPRYQGNDAEHKAAEVFEAELLKNNMSATREKVDLGNGRCTYNVIGKIEGTAEPESYIIIGSHIDSPENSVGATDGASGQGIQVEMARILANVNTNKTILIIGFGGEMLWFKGSEAFVDKHPDIVRNTEAVLDLNVVGAGENIAPISQSDLPETVVADPKLLELLQKCADELQNPLTIDQDAYPSDTYYFYKYNETTIPVVQIESRPFKVAPWGAENTPNKLDPEDMRKVGETVTMATLKLSNG